AAADAPLAACGREAAGAAEAADAPDAPLSEWGREAAGAAEAAGDDPAVADDGVSDAAHVADGATTDRDGTAASHMQAATARVRRRGRATRRVRSESIMRSLTIGRGGARAGRAARIARKAIETVGATQCARCRRLFAAEAVRRCRAPGPMVS
ncbi:TPA: hypothetical protein ACF6U4_005696, partial [Burkholderia multivorans]